jgi:quercetin dioxygenase-like cupin family protein
MRMEERISGWCLWTLLLACVPSAAALAQAMDHPMPPQGCVPAAERRGEVGCWIVAEQPVGRFAQAPYWQVDSFPDLAAAQAARSPQGTVVQSLGQVWLMTIADQGWKVAAGGTHQATIGPLPVNASHAYAAQYMEAVFTPGMVSRPHVHSGPEAWFTLSGETCLETPQGVVIDRPGDTGRVIPAGPPMMLMATGSDMRRGLVLILHDSAAPATTVVKDWTPKGLCDARLAKAPVP